MRAGTRKRCDSSRSPRRSASRAWGGVRCRCAGLRREPTRPDRSQVAGVSRRRWHFIGNIQSRRIRDIVDSASLIHSVYQEKHARKIDEVAREKGIVQDILIEVNVSGEESKSGVSPGEAGGSR